MLLGFLLEPVAKVVGIVMNLKPRLLGFLPEPETKLVGLFTTTWNQMYYVPF